MTALPREPLPRALGPPLIPRRRAMGPLTITSGVQGWVVVWIATRLKRGSANARRAATITGRCSGPAPASAALAAIVSSVAMPCRGASVATASSARRRPRIRATRRRVEGSTGRPSPQPWVITNSWKASRSSGPATVSAAGVAVTGAGSCVSAFTTASTIPSARLRTSSAGTPPIGCDTVTTGRWGRPSAAEAVRPREMNASVPRTTAGIPRPSSSAASWTLHDVQEPQSADPVRSTSAVAAISSWFAAGCEAPGLRQIRTDAASARSISSSATRPSSAPAFGLELSRTAMRQPVRLARRAARRLTATAAVPVGLTRSTRSSSGPREKCQRPGSNVAISYSICRRRPRSTRPVDSRASGVGDQERRHVVQHVRQRRERRRGAIAEHSEHDADEEDEDDARDLVLDVDGREEQRGERHAEARLHGASKDRFLPDAGGHRHQRRAEPRRDVRELEREAAFALVDLGKQPRFDVVEQSRRDDEGGRDDSRPRHLTPRDRHEAETTERHREVASHQPADARKGERHVGQQRDRRIAQVDRYRLAGVVVEQHERARHHDQRRRIEHGGGGVDRRRRVEPDPREEPLPYWTDGARQRQDPGGGQAEGRDRYEPRRIP